MKGFVLWVIGWIWAAGSPPPRPTARLAEYFLKGLFGWFWVPFHLDHRYHPPHPPTHRMLILFIEARPESNQACWRTKTKYSMVCSKNIPTTGPAVKTPRTQALAGRAAHDESCRSSMLSDWALIMIESKHTALEAFGMTLATHLNTSWRPVYISEGRDQSFFLVNVWLWGVCQTPWFGLGTF